MSTNAPGFQSLPVFFLHRFALAKLATSNIRVKNNDLNLPSEHICSESVILFYHNAFLSIKHAGSLTYMAKNVYVKEFHL